MSQQEIFETSSQNTSNMPQIAASVPVVCLGQTFASEDARREHFRRELRAKLPELKKIEGFPIGEDEDIINLSDPPFYTACPNPWLNDFIAEWEQEKESIPGRKKDFHVDEPYAGDVSEGKNNAIYTAHSYHTKVPHIAIMRYLLHYTQPGDTVLDAFGGTGMTGVASQFCEKPDIETKTKLEQEWQKLFGAKPAWGARKTILGDLSPLASFIAYNYNSPIDPQEFDATAKKIIDEVQKELSWMYETKHTDGRLGSINYTVWSEVFACGNCGSEIVFWDNAVDEEAGEVLEEFQCRNCKSIQSKNSLERFWVTNFDSKLSKTIKQPKYVPALIHYSVGNKSFLKRPDNLDIELVKRVDNQIETFSYPIDEIPKGVKTSELIRVGLTNVHHVYTEVLPKVWTALGKR